MADSDSLALTTDYDGDGGAPTAPQMPARIGRYLIRRQLGMGGFGLVYQGFDEQLNRLVAVKVPHERLVSQTADAEAYLAEARTVASLDHANIVPVYDVGSTPQFPCYVVSKYIDGVDLATRLHEAKPLSHDAAELVATIADALHHAHKQGVVHRDVKPGNILLDRNGKPFVADFGLALREAEAEKGPRHAGTVAYMSPEQARGEGHRVDGRSDVFSLGVVLYEMLTGRRPFSGDSRTELLSQITTLEPRPLRQTDDKIPRELERICLKALAKRASERYLTAQDFADDLRFYLKQTARGGGELQSAASGQGVRHAGSGAVGIESRPAGHSATERQEIRIVPKGLRSFDEHDADFFLELLPGPRDRFGLPESLRFWKTHIEEPDAARTFSVGLLYGPSGCGKSSFVKAGLLPLLSPAVTPVFVEASGSETEGRLMSELRRRDPEMPELTKLPEMIAWLRRRPSLAGPARILIVLDQFEQWLHAHRELAGQELTDALRHCDGQRVQCLLMVRDDFWMAATRFMRELEVRLSEGRNSASADLFDVNHARRVLQAFGRAFGALPDDPAAITSEQKEFLKQAIESIAEGGRVVCARLALFAEMLKSYPWVPETLQKMGGAAGIGVAFLEETFSSPTAPPHHRLHQEAARRVLEALLPEPGVEIKGRRQSEQTLREACGYEAREFEDLISILNDEVRLLTPIDPHREVSAAPAGDRSYQLTHDYLVPSIREWLSRKQRETRHGRAELMLAERTQLWETRHERQQLPTLAEWLAIVMLTKRSSRTDPQRTMLAAAGRYHVSRIAAALALVALLTVTAYAWRNRFVADSLVTGVTHAEIAAVPGIIEGIQPYRRWADPALKDVKRREADRPHSPAALRASLALLPVDAGETDYLVGRLVESDSREFSVIATAVQPHAARARPFLWGELEQSAGAPARRLRAASALAGIDPQDPRWRDLGPDVAALLTQDPLLSGDWAERLRPVREHLIAPLETAFQNQDPDRSREAALAGEILLAYSPDDTSRLSELLLDSDRGMFHRVYSQLATRPDAAAALTDRLNGSLPANWLEPPPAAKWQSIGRSEADQFEQAAGLIGDRFAWCQAARLPEFGRLAESLRPAGYRPVRVRPYRSAEEIRVAAVWTRDEIDWRLSLDLDLAQARQATDDWVRQGLIPVDIAGYEDPAGGSRFAVVCRTATDSKESVRVLLAVADEDLTDLETLARREGLSPVTAQRWRTTDGRAATNMIWTTTWAAKGATYSTFSSRQQMARWEQDLPASLARMALISDVAGCSMNPWLDRTIGAVAEIRSLAQAWEAEALYRRAMAQYRLRNYQAAASDLEQVATHPDAKDHGCWGEQLWNKSERPISLDAANARTGRTSLCITSTLDNDASAVQTVAVKPWTRYLYSGWIRTREVRIGQPGGRIAANLSLGFSGEDRSRSLEGTNDWTYVAVPFNSQVRDHVEIRARLGYAASTASGTAWFDDLCLIELEPEESGDIHGPDFLTPERQLRNLLMNGRCEEHWPELFERLTICYLKLGKLDEAQRALSRRAEIATGGPHLSAHLEVILAALRGRFAEAIDELQGLASPADVPGLVHYESALGLARLADLAEGPRARDCTDRVVALLERLAEQSPEFLNAAAHEFDFYPLHREPGLRRLLAAHQPQIWQGLVWREGQGWETRLTHVTSDQIRPTEYQALIAGGFRPVAIAVTAGEAPSSTVTLAWKKPVASLDARSRYHKRRANAAIGLIQMGHSARVWPLLGDPAESELQSQVIHRFGQFGVTADTLISELHAATTDPLRRILLLGLGEALLEQKQPAISDSLAQELVTVFREHPDPGVHGAADWSLRSAGKALAVATAEAEFQTGNTDGPRRWYLTRDGHTLAIIDADRFMMGSPSNESWRMGNESRHLKSIGRTLAAATTPITAAQFQRFLRDQSITRNVTDEYSPEPDCPQTNVNWFEAARYCNWLSEREGIDPDQWCYIPNSAREYAPGMRLAEGYLSRTGYRLPTESEWEFLCRAGTTTARYFGDSDELLPQYVWYNGNSQQRSWPVCHWKPNAFGLFDMLGNVFTWTQHTHVEYPVSGTEPTDDREQTLRVDTLPDRVIRGGAFNRDGATLRSAARNMEHPGFRNFPIGFRIVRTYPPVTSDGSQRPE